MGKKLCVSRSIGAVALLGLGIKSSGVDCVRRHELEALSRNGLQTLKSWGFLGFRK